MSYFMQHGDKFVPAESKEALLEGLPPGNFTVEQSMSGLYFQRTEMFQPTDKIYGNLNAWADRTLQTFDSREVSTGILLSGEKGSGKSLLGRLISLKAHEKKIPTITISFPFNGPMLISLLGHLTQSAIVFFDEFEKVYNDRDVQESVLSLLDGTLSTKHLFIITCNDTYRLSNFLLNRPGRIFYFIEFYGVEEGFIREYCLDNLKNSSEIESIINISKIFEKFNFDMLKSLVEEINRYGEPVLKAIELLNITPSNQNVNYKISIKNKNGKEYKKMLPDEFQGFPLSEEQFQFNCIPESTPENEDPDWEHVTFLDSDLKNFDPVTREFTYVNAEQYVLTFKTPVRNPIRWADAL